MVKDNFRYKTIHPLKRNKFEYELSFSSDLSKDMIKLDLLAVQLIFPKGPFIRE